MSTVKMPYEQYLQRLYGTALTRQLAHLLLIFSRFEYTAPPSLLHASPPLVVASHCHRRDSLVFPFFCPRLVALGLGMCIHYRRCVFLGICRPLALFRRFGVKTIAWLIRSARDSVNLHHRMVLLFLIDALRRIY